MAHKPKTRRKTMSEPGARKTPSIASRRQGDYHAAVMRELQRREESGESLDLSSIIAAATYQGSPEHADGTPLNRTTVYARKSADRTRVHEAIFTAIEAAVKKRAALTKRVRSKRSAADYEREIAELRESKVSLANQLVEARISEQQALGSKGGSDTFVRKHRNETYIMCKVISSITPARPFRIRSIIENFERDLDPRDLAELNVQAEEIVRDVRSRDP